MVKSLITQCFFTSSNSAQPLQCAVVRVDKLPIRKAHGFALIDLVFVCGVIGVLSSIALPRLLLARQSAGSASAIGTMRVIDSAQLTYALTCGSGFYAPKLTVLGTAPPASTEPFISPGLGVADTVNKGGYTITMSVLPFAGAPGSCNGVAVGAAGQGFSASADPLEPGNLRFFGTNASNIIYEHISTLSASMPESGPPPVGQMIVH
jgi:type II secretory pathway pseudopilin PulG